MDVSNDSVKWDANGYRLPTEAEWEKAARGGLFNKYFPWGDTIMHDYANYYSSIIFYYDISATRDYHPTYNDGITPYTSPVGSFAANDYGLYDMSGNVWEWCWDWYGRYSMALQINPLGPATGSYRVFRGGSWYDGAYFARCACRNGNDQSGASYRIGFRSTRRADQ